MVCARARRMSTTTDSVISVVAITRMVSCVVRRRRPNDMVTIPKVHSAARRRHAAIRSYGIVSFRRTRSQSKWYRFDNHGENRALLSVIVAPSAAPSDVLEGTSLLDGVIARRRQLRTQNS